jgi:hypothetical protein
MAAGVVELFPPNPPKAQQPPTGIYTRVLIERSATQGGAYAQIADVAIDTSDEFTYYADQTGDSTFWYKYRYSDGGVSFSGYSDETQAGMSVVREDARAEIPDLDITAAMWDRWGRLVLADLYFLGIWKEDEGEIVVTAGADGASVESYAVPHYIRDVYRVELRDNYGHVLDSLTDPEEVAFSATNRRIRIYDAEAATTSYRYWVVGKAQYRTMGELMDDFHVIALHMLLVRYLQFRKKQRANFKKFITFDPTTDVLPKDIEAMIAEEKSEVAVRAAALSQPEPPISIPN